MPYFKDLDGKLHWLDDISYSDLLPQGSIEITDSEAASLQSPTDAQLLEEFKASAKLALMATSSTMERIAEGVSLETTSYSAPDVVAWMQYRRQLRDCMSATVVGVLPVKPPYPSGT